MTVQFIRTTHENGRWRSFSAEAAQFWQQHGAVIGTLLRPETPLTFEELQIAIDEYASEHVADGPHAEQNRGYVAWVLVHLLKYGLCTAVDAPPPPPEGELNWPAVYPQLAEAG